MISTWLTIAMASSRYIAICHPLRARFVIDMRFTTLTTVGIIIGSISANIPRLWKDRVVTMACVGNWTAYYTAPGSLTGLHHKIYLWFYFLASAVIPLILLTTCNIYLIKALKKSHLLRRSGAPNATSSTLESSRRLTAILVGLVIMYISLVSPAEIVNLVKNTILDNSKERTHIYNLIVSIVNFLQVINFAFNFMLYCSVNSQFRSTFRQLLCLTSPTEPKIVKALDIVIVVGTDRSNNTTTTTQLANYGSVTHLQKHRQINNSTHL